MNYISLVHCSMIAGDQGKVWAREQNPPSRRHKERNMKAVVLEVATDTTLWKTAPNSTLYWKPRPSSNLIRFHWHPWGTDRSLAYHATSPVHAVAILSIYPRFSVSRYFLVWKDLGSMQMSSYTMLQVSYLFFCWQGKILDHVYQKARTHKSFYSTFRVTHGRDFIHFFIPVVNEK